MILAHPSHKNLELTLTTHNHGRRGLLRPTLAVGGTNFEELRKGQSDIQQSLVELTNLFTRFRVQPLEEAIQPPRNRIAANQERQERPRNLNAN